MRQKIKTVLFSILCICCFIPMILVSTGLLEIKRSGGMSTMGVIIGPIVGLPEVGGGLTGTVESDYSSSNLHPKTPYTNGALRPFKYIGVYNTKRDTKYGKFAYLSFCRYFEVNRNDGRVIYDDDGILDVTWDPNNPTNEVVDYPCYLDYTSTTLPSKNDGFLWSTRQAKLNGGYFYVNYYNYGTYLERDSKSLPTDPSNSIIKISDIVSNNRPVKNSNLFAISVSVRGYWKDKTWGNTGDNDMISENLSGYISVAPRNWSNSLSVGSGVGEGTYKGKVAYYSPKAFTPVATNLNNYLKVNDVQATPQYGTSVVPFRSGHHIYLTDEVVTKIDLEDGAENVYTTYYCFIDSQIPDVEFAYHNSNALTNRNVGNIVTTSTGAKSQTIIEGVFKDQVQVNFGYNADTEAPETATYTYNGKTYDLTSGTWLSDEGDYVLTVKDLAGNTTIRKFTIDKSNPSYNYDRISSDDSYKISKWYLVDIPYKYTNAGSYSFATYEMALNFAKQAEYSNIVTSYTLNDVNDFKYPNLVANGETIKVGDYWYYASRDNPNLFVYYFNPQSLDEVVEYYAKKFVSDEQVYKINATLSPNNYGNNVDSSVIDNVILSGEVPGFIANNFTFKYSNDNETYKIFYDYQEDTLEDWKEMQYGIPFISQANSHGLYKIKEIDFVGHETTYFVYLDLNAPMLDVEVKIYGKDKTLFQTISVADIPPKNELVFYYEKFKITDIVEDDKWWTLEIKCPDSKTRRYTYLDELPNFDELGSGEYTITIADRANNQFKFKLYLLGQAPEVKFETINTNTQLKVTIKNGESYNSIMDLKIYRNGICLNSELGYDEFPDNDTNDLIYINTTTLKYTFNKGGIYIVEISDNFGRVLSYEYKFEKDLPTGVLVGVTHNGKTKDEVKFIYDTKKYVVAISKDNQVFEPEFTDNNNLQTLFFYPLEESENFYKIQLIDKTDTENYNIYSFSIKTIKPIILLYGVEENGKTGGTVYATWENNEEQYTATYTLKGNTNEYKKGQVLSVEGNYTITLKDEIGNTSSVSFQIDKTIDFVIADANGNTYSIEDIRYINFDIRIIESEPLTVSISHNNNLIDYEFGLMISEEGQYQVRLYDEFNNSFYFTFTIDKTPPKATLYGVSEFGVTNKSAWVISSESNLSCWYVIDEEITHEYTLGKELTTHGKYVLYVMDLAKNYTIIEFQIDKKTSFDINVYRGGISNGDVRIVAYENLKIVMYKDSEPIEYSFEQILKEDGEYAYTITDELGNRTSSFFTIITKKKKNLNHILQENIVVESVFKDEENYEFEVLDGQLYLYDEGQYSVNILDKETDKKYSFNITIDTTAPTLELVGVENGGTTKKVVVMKNVSEKPYSIYITVDGVPFEYKIGDEIEKCGRFKVVLSDEAGNTTTYEFERLYSLNGPSIAVLAGLGALVVLVIILLVRSRRNYYKEEKIEEEIEETVIEDDFNDGDDENPKID